VDPKLHAITTTASSAASKVVRRIRGDRSGSAPPTGTSAITVHRPLDEVFGALAEPGLLSRVVPGLTEEITESGSHRFTWPAGDGGTGSAEYRITFDHPECSVLWEPVGDPGPLPRGGIVCAAAPGAWGTEIHAQLDETAPADPPETDQDLTLTPDRLVRTGLRHLKQVIETGEVMLVDLSSADRSAGQKRRTEKMSELLRTGGRP